MEASEKEISTLRRELSVVTSMLAESSFGGTGKMDLEPQDRTAGTLHKLAEEARHRTAMDAAAAMHDAVLADLQGFDTALEQAQAEAAAERLQWAKLREELREQIVRANSAVQSETEKVATLQAQVATLKAERAVVEDKLEASTTQVPLPHWCFEYSVGLAGCALD
jgi:chromosome segregation ATPase